VIAAYFTIGAVWGTAEFVAAFHNDKNMDEMQSMLHTSKTVTALVHAVFYTLLWPLGLVESIAMIIPATWFSAAAKWLRTKADEIDEKKRGGKK
jgi:hypothetical protein